MQGHYQSISQAGGRKGWPWKVFFPMMHFHYLHSVHKKNVLFKAVWLLLGVICGFQGIARWFKQHFPFVHPHVEFHNLLTFVIFPFSSCPKLLANILWGERGKHLVNVTLMPVWSCLPLQSPPLTVSATAKGRHCIIRWCPGITAGAPEFQLHYWDTISHRETISSTHGGGIEVSLQELLLCSLSCTLDLCGKVFATTFQSLHRNLPLVKTITDILWAWVSLLTTFTTFCHLATFVTL